MFYKALKMNQLLSLVRLLAATNQRAGNNALITPRTYNEHCELASYHQARGIQTKSSQVYNAQIIGVRVKLEWHIKAALVR